MDSTNSIPQTAGKIGVSRATVYDLMKKGELKSIKIGARRFVTDGQIAEFIEKLKITQSGAA